MFERQVRGSWGGGFMSNKSAPLYIHYFTVMHNALRLHDTGRGKVSVRVRKL